MKVPVNMLLDIDVKAWNSAYGIAGAEEIRADVTKYVAELVHRHLAHQGMLREPAGEVTR
jgi:hypothetical protein